MAGVLNISVLFLLVNIGKLGFELYFIAVPPIEAPVERSPRLSIFYTWTKFVRQADVSYPTY